MRRPKPTFDPIEEAYLHGHPNPERLECPGSDVLRQLAAKAIPISHPACTHVTRCSPCFQEFRAFEKEMVNHRRHRMIISMRQVGVAAAFVLVAILGLLTFRHSNNREQHVQAAMLNFATSIERGGGSEQRTVPGAVQAYPRRVLLITMSLPPGSEDGLYDFEVVPPDGNTTLIQAQSKAQIANGLTTITQKVDLSRLEPSLYIARVKHPPFGQWREVPIRVE